MDDFQPVLTVFTPTYNRAHTLRRLYDSLIQMGCDKVEWLVVDDGSADRTAEAVAEFSREGKVQIRYIKKENGGKHTALNEGIRQARGDYFLCVDSDDCLEEDALEHIFQTLQSSPEGVIAYKSYWNSGERIGAAFPESLTRTTLFSLINDYKCSGDRTLIYRTDILKQIRIPEPTGYTFFPETYLYDRFDERHCCVLLPVSLCRCEYMAGGYSDTFRMLMIRNALPMKWFYADRMDMPCRFSQRFSSAWHYVGYSLLAPGKQGRYKGKYRWMMPLAMPFGLAMYLVYGYYRMMDRRK